MTLDKDGENKVVEVDESTAILMDIIDQATWDLRDYPAASNRLRTFLENMEVELRVVFRTRKRQEFLDWLSRKDIVKRLTTISNDLENVKRLVLYLLKLTIDCDDQEEQVPGYIPSRNKLRSRFSVSK
jgi:hypothetical protein